MSADLKVISQPQGHAHMWHLNLSYELALWQASNDDPQFFFFPALIPLEAPESSFLIEGDIIKAVS